MRYILYLLLFFTLPCLAQVQFEAVTSNFELERQAAKGAIMRGPYDHTEKHVIQVLGGTSQTFCVDTLRDFKFLDTIMDQNCSAISYGIVSILGSCITYQAQLPTEDLRKDSICFNVCDAKGNCKPLTLIVYVRKARSIPFQDDFSSGGPYPNPKNWLDENVYVNNRMTKNPPTIGVATFDGLNSDGQPYGGSTGGSDTLTSTYFDLSTFGNPDQVYLSFFAQARGLGPTLTSKDSLVVQMKTSTNIWRPLYKIGWPGNMGLDSLPPFVFNKIPVFNLGAETYLHNSFQFRFISYGDRKGASSMWNLDYVRLKAGEPDSTILDVAFTDVPSSFLQEYTAMPWNQFRDYELQEIRKTDNQFSVEIGISNLFSQVLTAEPSTLNIKEITTNTPIVNNFTLLEVPPIAEQNQRDLAPGKYQFVRKFDLGPVAVKLQDNFAAEGKYTIQTDYQFTQAQELASGIPELGDNNFARFLTQFDNEFAYDDGTAEFHLIAVSDQSQPSQIAVRFHANKPDTLQAIRMHIPHVKANVGNQLFNLKVWIGQLDDSPEYASIFVKPVYADQFYDTLQGFTTYQLEETATKTPTPLAIPAGDFYIGWQQVTFMPENEIPVGFDRNSIGGFDKIWLNRQGNWVQLDSFLPKFSGSLMLRPVMGNIHTGSTATMDQAIGSLSIYPNPGNGLFTIDMPVELGQDAVMQIFQSTGQLIYSGAAKSQIDLQNRIPGLYQVVIRQSDRSIWSGKLSLLNP
ncbi:MAG: T9SS type A sorting domain-containing protein [Saprospiraceae bacterium]